MTPDHTELPEDIGQALGRLGRVASPDPGVLDAAREILWAAVAAEMLPDEVGGAGQAGRPGGSRRAAQREAGQREAGQREAGQREAGERQTDQPGQADRLRPGDPGA